MNLRLLLVHPGASWSTADVFDGLNYGLQAHGVTVIPYRLDTRIEASHKALHWLWRTKRKDDPTLEKPNAADVIYHAGEGVLAMALRHQAHFVIVVSASLLHPDVILIMKRAGLRIVVLFTESPYDLQQELKIAAMVEGCWTHERTVVEAFRAVNRNAGYLPHAWHPLKHYPAPTQRGGHDVVFVGSGFPDRIAWFNAIDWTGIDLGLYGTWNGVKASIKPSSKDVVTNEAASALYRNAKIGLNLYRHSRIGPQGWQALEHETAASLNPRAYELAACGAFHLSEARQELRDVFGDLVPTFSTPQEAVALIRAWLADPAGRDRIARQLPACVAESSWVARAATVLGDLQRLIPQQAA